MKRLYISDVIHEHLKQEAKQEGRTLQWIVEEKLTGNTPPVISQTKESPPYTQIKEVTKILNEAPVPEEDRYVLDETGEVHGPTKKRGICPQHGISKEDCKLMKHKGK